ncbi:MAG TPA: division/cell wall cluster transcriptional repressor MraZ [Accumulibacter sp.]|uniref:division/cell wall cluster transcriptional repressor MraZ n=1 Tax=Accumulibacter sp. TaxID=2053492 RepID=UPI00261676AE|nr:division/cell wall cluster transcriptional repressor MraZ [Accumulibacter sp.]MDS4056365.1 division/cell wall cluster transcriptional repressor MraZ [Accumulibacter sp.]HMV04305.1 division/cell wall cluster transcriptional repressor MraZ [Accumulibacter sp.]HMW63374.1 division/cell wall cluster transcriptional repressor MraZ [Accumulibacter sp.]HMW80029.1 division/cell wall cluster transcriptional repressor MraZ [Accumulibacter sp.]HMX67719.1 division/cell wall cluster transcriptional repre
MFQGAASLSLDVKGRIAIPARHREALAAAANGRLIVTAHPHRCLLLYPEPAWEPIRDKVLAASSFNLQSAAIKRLLVGNAREEEMDATGRLLIAPELRHFAQLERLVWLVGQGSHFEIWSDAGWQRQQETILALDNLSLPPELEDLAL